MSKKSRRRNKKILAALALAGGAAMMAKRKKASIAGMDDAGINVTHPALTAKNWISKKSDTTPVVKKPPVDHGFQTRFTKKVDGKWMGPGQIIAHNKLTAGNKVPPSMRGGAPVAEGYQRKYVTGRTGRGKSGITYGYSGQPLKKGGSVTGVAKRGFGRALMNSKK